MALALVSGISGGIGSVVARRCWREGYSILGIGTTIRHISTATVWFRTHPRTGQVAWCCIEDLRHTGNMWQIEGIIRDYGPVALVAVCHGAAGWRGKAEDAEGVAMAEQIIGVDVLGAYRLCVAAYPSLCAHGSGTIALVSSIHANATYPERVPYAIAKSAMGGLMRGLAVEWGKDNITVNMLTPWQVEGTRTTAIAAHEGEDTLQRYTERSPLRRLVDPEDIATTILWLTQCRSITGSEIALDCGVRASAWHHPFTEGKTRHVSP